MAAGSMHVRMLVIVMMFVIVRMLVIVLMGVFMARMIVLMTVVRVHVRMSMVV